MAVSTVATGSMDWADQFAGKNTNALTATPGSGPTRLGAPGSTSARIATAPDPVEVPVAPNARALLARCRPFGCQILLNPHGVPLTLHGNPIYVDVAVRGRGQLDECNKHECNKVPFSLPNLSPLIAIALAV